MNIFGVCVLLCGIAVSIGHPLNPLNNQQNIRYVRQSPAQQLRTIVGRQPQLRNYPLPQSPYQTLKIDYPGSSSYQGPFAYVTNKPVVNSRVDYQRVGQSFPNQPVQMNTFASQSEQQQISTNENVQSQADTQVTTTQSPIIVNEDTTIVEDEVTQAPVPVSTARNPPTRSHLRTIKRIRPVQQPVQQQQFEQSRNAFEQNFDDLKKIGTKNPEPVQRFEQNFGQDFVEHKSILPKQVVVHTTRAPYVETEEERLLREEQAKSAHYSFGTSINDKINDHAISREETREGLALRGMYSYSDGYFKRTIHYEADEKGYRVVKEEIEPIGNGPQFNPAGTADVTADLHDNHLQYSITADDFVREKKKKKVVSESAPFEEDDEFFE